MIELIKTRLDQYRPSNALEGPWMGQALAVNATWVESALKNKINAIDWRDAAKDVERFLNIAELPTLKLWSNNFFNQKVKRLFGK